MEGQVFGRYRITTKIGEGGMAEVWAAKHEVLADRDAAIKLLLPEMSLQQQIVKRFFQEAQAAARIQHPGIVNVFDVGYTEAGRAYIVMERLFGETLSTRLQRQHTLPVTSATKLVRQLASAIDAAHQRGIIHRDLKPGNLMITPAPEAPGGERVKIVDFGLAKLAVCAGSILTARGAVFGTPLYMAPEQCQDAAAVDARADLYAIGCIFYRCLCGRTPFSGGGIEVLAAQMNAKPVPPRKLRPDIAPGIDAVIMRLLAKSPADRIQSGADLIDALDAAEAAAPVAVLDEVATHPMAHPMDEVTLLELCEADAATRDRPLPGVSPPAPHPGRQSQAQTPPIAQQSSEQVPPGQAGTLIASVAPIPASTSNKLPTRAGEEAGGSALGAAGTHHRNHAGNDFLGTAGDYHRNSHKFSRRRTSAMSLGEMRRAKRSANDNRRVLLGACGLLVVGSITAGIFMPDSVDNQGIEAPILTAAHPGTTAADGNAAPVPNNVYSKPQTGGTPHGEVAGDAATDAAFLRAMTQAQQALQAQKWAPATAELERAAKLANADETRLAQINALREQLQFERFRHIASADDIKAMVMSYAQIPEASPYRAQAIEIYAERRDRWLASKRARGLDLANRLDCSALDDLVAEVSASFPDESASFASMLTQCGNKKESLSKPEPGAKTRKPVSKPEPGAKTRKPVSKPEPGANDPTQLIAGARNSARQGNYDRAYQQCTEALKLQPDQPEAIFLCNLAACKLKKWSAAKRYFTQLQPRYRNGVLQTCLKAGRDPRLR